MDFCFFVLFLFFQVVAAIRAFRQTFIYILENLDTFSIYFSFFRFCHQSWFLHLWIINWCKWPYWSLDCDARMVKLLLNMKLSAYYQLYPLYHNLNVLAVCSFESWSVENTITAKTDVSHRVGFSPHCSKKGLKVGSLL